ncbi:MAG TPA: MmgE/PrpD family protein [Xanthobacteraceae bacterium]
MTQTMVQRIAGWVLAFDTAMVDARAIELIKHSVLDSLGCAILTLSEDCVSGVLNYARSIADSGGASLIGGGQAPLTLATLVNGTLVRAIDFNDHLAFNPNTGAKLGGHPSDNFAAILAVAEERDRSGREVVAALLASYELYGRVTRFLTPELPWDHTTAFGVTVPAAAARLLGLDSARTANAIAISAAQSASLGAVRRGQLSHSKFLASALVAERGVEASLLAAAGVTGPMTVFENTRGIAKGVFHADDLETLVAPLGGLHMVEGVTIKAYPGMDTSQAAAEAAVKSAAGRKLRARDIESIELVMNDHPMTLDQSSDPVRRTPHSRETADHSYQYIVAVALLDGELTPRQFRSGRWLDPDVCDLMNRMTIANDPAWTRKALGGFPCTVRLRTSDGRVTTVEVPFATGHARNKMSHADVVAKFRYCVDGRLSPGRADEIIAAVDNLDRLPSIRSLTSLLS